MAALVLVVSGVAMVSAYEAYLINVTAHTENAMKLIGVGFKPDYHLEFGTVFPEEWVLREFQVSTSSSFCARTQTKARDIYYSIYVVPKVKDEGPPVVYYPWLGDALYIGIDAVKEWPSTVVGNPGDLLPVGSGGSSVPVVSGVLEKFASPPDTTDDITVGLDVPVFEGYWNPITDALANPNGKPSGLDEPTVELTGDRNVPSGIDLGADIVIQITHIHRIP